MIGQLIFVSLSEDTPPLELSAPVGKESIEKAKTAPKNGS
jgi:hypothetical protein